MKVLYKEVTMCEGCPHHRVWVIKGPLFESGRDGEPYNCCTQMDRGTDERQFKTTMPRYNGAPMEIASVGCPIGANEDY